MAVIKNLNQTNAFSSSSQTSLTTVVGELVGVDENGAALVSFDGMQEPVVARSALSKSDCESINELPAKVLISFAPGEQNNPLISGIVRETLFPLGKSENKNVPRSGQYKANIDGQIVEISGKDQILLECGKSSILLRKDGKVIIKGVNVVSRSSATNKIKGSSVKIN